MDIHSLMNMLHIFSVTILFLVLVARTTTLLIGVQGQQPNPVARTPLIALQHVAVTLIVVSAIFVLFIKQFQVEPWFYAKLILFFVMLSAFAKAFKKDEPILLIQRRAGCVIGFIAFFCVLGLAMIKPVFT